MGKAVVQGKDLSGVQAQDQATGWVVVFNVKSPASHNLGTLTTTMSQQYYPSVTTNPNDQVLDLLAVVLDGELQGAPPQVTSPDLQLRPDQRRHRQRLQPEPGHDSGQRAEVRQPAAVVPQPEHLVGIGIARLGSAVGGPVRRAGWPAARGDLLVHLLPRARRGIGVEPGHRRSADVSVRGAAVQVRGLHADPGGHRRAHRRDRHHRRLVHRLLRATAGTRCATAGRCGRPWNAAGAAPGARSWCRTRCRSWPRCCSTSCRSAMSAALRSRSA